MPGPSEEPVVLFVDDVELEALAGAGGRRALTDVVRRELSSEGSPYARILQKSRTWDPSSRDAPPTLPLLAVTVLAATDMEATATISSLNYYTRLTALLAPEVGGTSWRRRLEQHFPSVATEWRTLHGWITGPCQRTSTIVENPQPVHIGYPLSQALIRRTDQHALSLFWHRAGLEPGQDQPPASELLRDLRSWMRPHRGFSQQFQRSIQDRAVEQILGELLSESLRNWDGSVRDRAGRRVDACRLSVRYEGGAARAEWLVGPLDDPPSLRTVNFSQDHLLRGFSSDSGAPLRAASPVVLLRFESLVQRWVEVPDFRMSQEHGLIWNSDEWGDAAKEFVLSSDNGSQSLIRPVRGCPKLRAVLGISFTDRRVLQAALTRAALRGLTFESQQRPRLALTDGLRLSNRLGKRVYVHGGAPNLVLPEGEVGEMVEVALDGLATRFERSGLAFPLRWRGVEPGDHQVSADKTSLHFEISSHPERVLGRPEPVVLAYPIQDGATSSDATSTHNAAVSGALVLDPQGSPRPGPWDLYAVARRGMRATYLLGPNGHVREIKEPAPGWIWKEIAANIAPMIFSVLLEPHERWLVQVGRLSTYVDEVGSQRIDGAPVGKQSIDWATWHRVISDAAKALDSDNWRAFVAKAGSA